MASVTECLNKMQDLTNQNLKILQAINDSFFSKQNHLTVDIEGVKYAIPSFLHLENKINALQENFVNLVNAPKNGEAYFSFDGNSQVIEMRGFECTPESVILPEVNTFNVYQNDIFKDFLYPNPYINFNISSIPNDINKVNVKKIVPITENATNIFKEFLGDGTSKSVLYADLYKKIYNLKENTDFIEYDKAYSLPIRKNIGSATYVIESIISDVINNDLDEIITLKLRNDLDETIYSNKLYYKRFDETIEVPLKVGDCLTTFNHGGKVEILELRPTTNTIVVKVLNGEYLNFIAAGKESYSEYPDNSKLRFFSPVDFDNDKNISIPLEEDRYIFVAVAPLNDRMNVQSSWGGGVVIDTYKLKDDNGNSFDEYYSENVRNIGDILYQISAMSSNSISKYSGEKFKELIDIQPVINEENLVVTQINTHLNNSTTIKNIRSLYSQKKQYNTELTEVQSKIDEINKQLSSITFDDTTNLRSAYTAQLTEYNSKKTELTNSIIKIVDEIAIAANNSEVPIENAKYRIRGFHEITTDPELIKGIRVQYRYKNIDQEQGSAISIKDKFIFSDWNNMDGFDKLMRPSYKNNEYIYTIDPENANINEPSYNQIDIPISQGETVDIRLRLVYNIGSPFIEMTSQWSEIVNIKFPDEFLKDIQILDIITENNNDIETNRFNNILIEEGVPTHLNDKIIDQDITYFHKPENIASGFYTEERRIIPLKDKLSEINSTVIALNDLIKGSSSEALSIKLINGEVTNDLQPFQMNNISVSAYDSFIKVSGVSGTDGIEYVSAADGSYDIDPQTGVATTVLNIVISNTSSNTVNLYSLFPGSRDVLINNLIRTKFVKEEYCNGSDGVWMGIQSKDPEFKLQGSNQFIYFRTNDLYDGIEYYKEGNQFGTNDMLSLNKDFIDYVKYMDSNKGIDEILNSTGASLYPYIKDEFSLCMDSDTKNTYITINPKENIIVPLIFEYKIEEDKMISKIISFDIRTSLYNDPINYTIKVTAKYSATPQDKLLTTNRKANNNYEYHTTVIK